MYESCNLPDRIIFTLNGDFVFYVHPRFSGSVFSMKVGLPTFILLARSGIVHQVFKFFSTGKGKILP